MNNATSSTMSAGLRWLRLRLTPDSAFSTPLRGDTLFGQLCWRILETQGSEILQERLQGYQESQPFVVISDPFPADHLPRPQLPADYLGLSDGDPVLRKVNRGKRWLPHSVLRIPLNQWGEQLRDDKAMLAALKLASDQPLRQVESQPHNSIHRLTMTTGEDEQFAPFSSEQYWLHSELSWDLYLLHDTRISAEELLERLNEIGQMGYGKDASIGKGRFHVERCQMPEWPVLASCQRVLTLAPCAIQQGEWCAEESFYTPMVRFGRHGATAAISGVPWKNPLLLADTAALLTLTAPLQRPLVGRGLGGDGQLSYRIPQTVHQGYAPVVGVITTSAQGVHP